MNLTINEQSRGTGLTLTSLLIIAVVVFVISAGYGLIFLLALVLASYDSKRFARSFDTATPDDDSNQAWPVVYRTQLEHAMVPVLVSRLKSEDIPVIEHNKNLFNSGLHWEFGLSVPLELRVPEEQYDRARSIVERVCS